MELFNVFNLTYNTYVVGIVTFIIIAYYLRNRNKNHPGGPFPLPLIGTVYKHGFNIQPDRMTQLSNTYGNVFSIYVGPKKMVVVNGYKEISEMLYRPHDFSNKGSSENKIFKKLNPDWKGMAFLDYTSKYIETRKLSISILKTLGVGKAVMEERIIEEVNCVIDLFEQKNGRAFNPYLVIDCAVANITVHLLLNKRCKYDDATFIRLQNETKRCLSLLVQAVAIDEMPLAIYIPQLKSIYNDFLQSFAYIKTTMAKFATEILQEDNASNSEGDNFVECFAQKKSEHIVSEDGSVDIEHLSYVLTELALGGFESTATLMKWMFVYLANRPAVQEKVFAEIDSVVGTERKVAVKDREELPYLQAVIHEVLRYSNIGSLLNHFTNLERDVMLQNVNIPKKSVVLINIHSVHMDPAIWGDPEVFRPERFINEEGKFFKHAAFMSFSTGRRSCPGELLARQELSLFAGNLLQKFKICPPEGMSEIDERPEKAFLWTPKPFNMRAILRHA